MVKVLTILGIVLVIMFILTSIVSEGETKSLAYRLAIVIELAIFGIVGILFVVSFSRKPTIAIIGLIVAIFFWFSQNESPVIALVGAVGIIVVVEIIILTRKKEVEVKETTPQLDARGAVNAINRELERRNQRRK